MVRTTSLDALRGMDVLNRDAQTLQFVTSHESARQQLITRGKKGTDQVRLADRYAGNVSFSGQAVVDMIRGDLAQPLPISEIATAFSIQSSTTLDLESLHCMSTSDLMLIALQHNELSTLLTTYLMHEHFWGGTHASFESCCMAFGMKIRHGVCYAMAYTMLTRTFVMDIITTETKLWDALRHIVCCLDEPYSDVLKQCRSNGTTFMRGW